MTDVVMLSVLLATVDFILPRSEYFLISISFVCSEQENCFKPSKATLILLCSVR
jgi:hypothetical protein